MIDIELKTLGNIIKGCGDYAVISLFNSDYKKHLQILKESRLEICSECKLFKEKVCDSKKKDKVVIDFNYKGKSRIKDSIVNGCGCNLECKTLVPDEQCPLGKWLSVEL